MLITILIILVLIIVIMFYSIFRIQKNYKLDIEKNTIYQEILYIKALLVLVSIVLVFFGWNINVNVKNDISQDLKTKIEQDFSTALNGFIIEVILDTCKTEINYKFKELKDIKGKSINNKQDFKIKPIVSLNYIGQPYTVTQVNKTGFTVSKMEIPENFTWGGLKPKEFEGENKLIH